MQERATLMSAAEQTRGENDGWHGLLHRLQLLQELLGRTVG